MTEYINEGGIALFKEKMMRNKNDFKESSQIYIDC